jgi:hypothetical protein
MHDSRADTSGDPFATSGRVEPPKLRDRRSHAARGRRSTDIPAGDISGFDPTSREVARLRTAVEALADSMQAHAEAVRALVNAVQTLTATRHKLNATPMSTRPDS